jgi:hypothetical protein
LTVVKDLADDFWYDGTDGAGSEGTQQETNTSGVGIKEKLEEGKQEGTGDVQGDKVTVGGGSSEQGSEESKDATVSIEKGEGGTTTVGTNESGKMSMGGKDGADGKELEGGKKSTKKGGGKKREQPVKPQKQEEVQNRYYQAIGSQKLGRQWTVAIIQKMWDVVWDLWEQWNGIMHSEENEVALHIMEVIDAEICYQFQQGPEGLPQRVRYPFAGRVDDLLKTSIHTRKAWLRTVEGAWDMVTMRRARERSALAPEQQLMRAWLSSQQ